jgi:GNAT superfamily N-acetyltransferase
MPTNEPASAHRIRLLSSPDESEIEQLADVLIDCVERGASVSFMAPLARGKAIASWRRVGASVAAGERILLAGEIDGRILGTVQVVLAQTENQPHRGDLSKMLVHSAARRRGLGEALLRRAEHEAQAVGKTLLVLDTADATAERLYARTGWVHAGTIPDYALWPHGGLCDTRLYYRRLG